MSKGKLTRQELGWLLTQEAQGAAERLRRGVSALTQPPPPSESSGADTIGVDATFSVLDDAMKMLSSLHARQVNVRGRRGRIDLAALLWEVAPEARVSIEPGSGTEVFGDEAELRRMLHVILGHGSGSGSAVSIKREADEVIVVVVLGPDSSPTADTERAWLSRMAIRYGGRYELEGSTEVL
ncbi:MAG: sensor histidine kinase, partial [Polyangiaceae bacterium]